MQAETPINIVIPLAYYDINAPTEIVEIREYYEGIVKKLQSANQTGIILYQEKYMTEENKHQSQKDIVNRLVRLYSEQDSLNEQIKEVKDESKAIGYKSALLARVAKAIVKAKTTELLEQSEEIQEIIEEVRNS